VNIRRLILTAAAVLVLVPTLALAQPDKGSYWTGYVAGGWGIAQGDAADSIDDGWTISGGAVFKEDQWPIGISFGLEYSEYDLDREIVDFYEGSGGDVEIWGLTAGGMWSTKTQGPVDFYINAGAGMYTVKARIYEVGLVAYPPYCPPYSWWCYPGGVGSGTYVKGSDSTTKAGFYGALGVTFETASLNQFYIEARYQQIQTKQATEMVPIVIGFRW
jgi:hypothetical protein